MADLMNREVQSRTKETPNSKTTHYLEIKTSLVRYLASFRLINTLQNGNDGSHEIKGDADLCRSAKSYQYLIAKSSFISVRSR